MIAQPATVTRVERPGAVRQLNRRNAHGTKNQPSSWVETTSPRKRDSRNGTPCEAKSGSAMTQTQRNTGRLEIHRPSEPGLDTPFGLLDRHEAPCRLLDRQAAPCALLDPVGAP